jgi:hypothetical protein
MVVLVVVVVVVVMAVVVITKKIVSYDTFIRGVGVGRDRCCGGCHHVLCVNVCVLICFDKSRFVVVVERIFRNNLTIPSCIFFDAL